MHRIFILAGLALSFSAPAQANPQAEFFAALGSQCDSRWAGETVFPEDPGEDFRDQPLYAHVAQCGEQEIRIPFQVGENRSRTWILRLDEGQLSLKHDHRHEDGTPDEITNYGGVAVTGSGSATSQSFPADAETAELIPEASTNEWFLSLSEDGTQLTYYLERHGKPRYKALLSKQ